MLSGVHKRSSARRPPSRRGLLALLLLAILLAGVLASGCGSSLRGKVDGDDARADIDDSPHSSCATTVLGALGSVAQRVYAEGVQSERTASALKMIESSSALREAVEAGDVPGARRAAKALIATGHLTDLRVVRGAGSPLIDLGGPALAPLRGTLAGADGKPIASFVTSVWADGGLIAETNGIAEASTVLQSGTHQLGGEFTLPAGQLPPQGTLTREGVAYQYTSFAAGAYPDGAPVRVYLLRSISSIEPLCGTSEEDTVTSTLSRIARLIYQAEAGQRTLTQIHRVQRNGALLQAVVHRDPAAARTAVKALLHHHIVRLRVSAAGKLLSDVGGPFVLAPVQAPLKLHGRPIGSFVLSIQDDEGYKRLANRLAGLDVLMYMGTRLVKSTIGFSPGPVPRSGPFSYRGKNYRAFTFDAKAFPSGPLRITTLIPIPYS